tara:strand:- start:3837 stop:4253 length:417 start_codon:yes stop_codon:yes gene_type:complete
MFISYITELLELAAFTLENNKEIWDIYILNLTCISFDTIQVSKILTEDDLKTIVLNFWEHEWLTWHPENNYYVKLLVTKIFELQEYVKILEINFDIMMKINEYHINYNNNHESGIIKDKLITLRDSALFKLKHGSMYT